MSNKYIISGGKQLSGEIEIGGAKNAILPILAATLMCQGPVMLHNCPRINDVYNMLSILTKLGCNVDWNGDHSIIVDTESAFSWEMPDTLSKQLRSSIFMLGPIVARFKKAYFSYPGGCEIGVRPIDLHLKGLRELNVDIEEKHGHILCRAENMRGADISLDYPSVGATENIMMAATLAKGDTTISNAAREPEIVDLQNFLNKCGAKIYGAGSSTIYIKGDRDLKGVEHTLIPDRIVAGTYMIAAAITKGEIDIKNTVPEHMSALISKLREADCKIYTDKDVIHVIGPDRPKEMRIIETLPYPGFPTDMQAQIFAFACLAKGTSVIVENVFDNRFKHVSELTRMGANITVKDRTAVIRGVESLTGTEVYAQDLRGGAALVLAGLRAEGNTIVNGLSQINRGYENLCENLKKLGADIVKV